MTLIATVIKFALVVLVSYLLGSLNFSIIFSKGVVKKDIRESGSGNAGATNMLRTYGKKFALLTMLGDIIKVAIAIIIAFLIFGSPVKYLFASPTDPTEMQQIMFYKQFAGFFCVIGHIFPVFFKFKGGKGVAACTGMVIMVDWRIALILFVIFVIIVAISKWISLGSITIAVLYPVLLYAFYKNIIVTLIALIFAVMVVVAHRQNIKRILNKTENKISFKKKK